jgi:hypothetical protein
MSKPMFKIVPDSIVKGSGDGYMVCQTEPVHPHAVTLKDHKAKYIYVHIVKMENHLGRLLKKGEQVDHRDGNNANNDMSNLRLTENGPHQREHAKGEKGHKPNKFWKKSPRTKKRESALKVATIYLHSNDIT